jgi:L-iditol 2-dehydrogenase
MKAAVFHGPSDVRIQEVPKPTPGPGEVVCKVAAVGVCGTDIEIYLGTMVYFRMGIASYPWVGGHEWCGIVDSVGEGVTTHKPGDRIVAEVTLPCGKCPACKEGRPQLCWPRTEIGVTGRYQGAFADYIVIPASIAIKVPDGVSLREAVMTEPVGVVVHGVDIMGIRPGDRVVTLGDGPIGILSAQVAKAFGASKVVMVGSRELRMKAAEQTGVTNIVSRHDPDVRDKILALLGGTKATSIIDSSGNPKGLELATSLVELGGKILTFGLYQTSKVEIDLDYLVVNEIQLFTSLAASATFPRVLRMMEQKQVDVLPLQGPYYPFDEVKEAIEAVAQKRIKWPKSIVVHEDILD